MCTYLSGAGSDASAAAAVGVQKDACDGLAQHIEGAGDGRDAAEGLRQLPAAVQGHQERRRVRAIPAVRHARFHACCGCLQYRCEYLWMGPKCWLRRQSQTADQP